MHHLIENLSRWMHLVFGILWIGHLYYFNFVQAGFEGKLTADMKKVVVPENRPRALYWFRWGALWTWVTGVLLVGFNYHMAKSNFGAHATLDKMEVQADPTPLAMSMFLIPLVLFFVYDIVAKKVGGGAMSVPSLAVNLVIAAGYVALGHFVAKLGGRALWIHTGILFGTTMMMNVWMRIWPAQRRIITAIKGGTAPDQADVGLAGARSRHNTYMSVLLMFFMLTQHSDGTYNALVTTFLGANSPLVMVVVTAAVGFVVANILYKKAAKVSGF